MSGTATARHKCISQDSGQEAIFYEANPTPTPHEIKAQIKMRTHRNSPLLHIRTVSTQNSVMSDECSQGFPLSWPPNQFCTTSWRVRRTLSILSVSVFVMFNLSHVLPTSFVEPRYLIRISYSLEPQNESKRYKNAFNPYYQCNPEGRLPLPLPMEKLLNVTTTISTDLKILFMGDSVGIQFFQVFEEAAGASFGYRRVLRYSWGTHEGLTLSAPVRGGGHVAGWRITGMLTRKGENRHLPNYPGGGWVREDVAALLKNSSSIALPNNNGESRTIASFDCMVFRIPYGWLTFDEITDDSFLQTVDLAHELFGVSTIVFVSMPFVNNIQNLQHLDDLKSANERLRNFAQRWTAPSSSSGNGVKHVFVLEFGHFVDQLLEWNARLMGYNTSNQNYTMDRLSRGRLKRSIPHVCGERPKLGSPDCTANFISLDGMRGCMESIGNRVFAGIACLLGCAHNDPHGGEKRSAYSIHQSESQCNLQFMSLNEASLRQARVAPPSVATARSYTVDQ